MNNNTLRIDRWLWFARFFKTRGLATAAVVGGHVKINSERASPGDKVREGDTIDLIRDRLPYRMRVELIPLRRGPAKEAVRCYSEAEKIKLRRQDMIDTLRQDRRLMPRTDGRPDKHTRRELRVRRRKGDATDQD